MKKPFLFFAMLLLGAAGLLRAQETVLFSDDFESGNHVAASFSFRKPVYS